ncbi:MAG TPA: tRNA (adenosine(37)-N6)-threonylcarbamoyltransferase complex dimerization subunit type 1 TsaB [Gemmatimonadales bacterium]
MWLALDTATDQASLALGAPGADQALEENILGARRQAGALLPTLQSLLDRARITLDAVDGIVLSDGPGSFTGLRIGASVAKALVQSRKLPLWTAPSLMVRAAGAARPDLLVLAIANALRGEIYSAGYRFLSEGIRTELIPAVRRPGDLIESHLSPDVVIGEAPPEVLTQVEGWSGRRVVGPPESFPRASRLLWLVGRPGGAREVDVVREWEPVYGRPAEAQARWEIAHGRPLSDSIGSSR